MDPVETKKISGSTVACDGGALGHPRVFLNLGDDGVVDCPYCGCRFVHESRAADAGAGDAGAGDAPAGDAGAGDAPAGNAGAGAAEAH